MLQTFCARPKSRALVVLEARGRKPFRPLPILVKEDGQPAETREDRDGVWLQHFGQQRYKSTASVNEFLALDDEPIEGDTDITWAPEDLSTPAEVERKTAGLDNLPGELLRSGQAAMARIAQRLILKATAMAGFCQPV